MEKGNALSLLFAFCLIALLLPCSCFGADGGKLKVDKEQIKTWACYYGDDPISLRKLETYDLVIIEPDIEGFSPPEKTKTHYIGYISLGEAERFRWYWQLIDGQDFILWENENWKDDFILDIRSMVWQNLVVEKIIPQIVAKGYTGLFFDTIDTPIFLEEMDGEKYEGSCTALGAFILRIRQKFPNLILVSNNGLRAIQHFGAYIDVFLIEGLVTTYDFAKKKYHIADRQWRDTRISFVQKNSSLVKNKPILVIDYLLPKDKHLRSYSLKMCRQYGFNPYHTTVDLTKLFPSPQ